MPPEDQYQLSAVLRFRERQRAHMTVRQLAEIANSPRRQYRGRTGSVALPTPDLLQRLARALGIDAEELYAPTGYLVPGLPITPAVFESEVRHARRGR